MRAVGARGGIPDIEIVGVEGAVPLEPPPEPVDVVRVPEAGHEVRLRALQEADLIWKCGEVGAERIQGRAKEREPRLVRVASSMQIGCAWAALSPWW